MQLTCHHARSPQALCSLLLCQTPTQDGGSNKAGDSKKQDDYVEALKKGGIDKKTARDVLQKWKDAGLTDGDPNELRKLFLKQSAAPITASLVQVRMADTHTNTNTCPGPQPCVAIASRWRQQHSLLRPAAAMCFQPTCALPAGAAVND